MARLGGLSRQRRGRPLNAEVNIINLVDVMLVLLIIFMVTAPILQGGIQVNLPKVNAQASTSNDQLIVTVEKSGRVSVGANHLSVDQFEMQVLALASKYPAGMVVQGDAGASWGIVAHVLDVARKAGIDKANLATQPADTP